MEKELIIPFLLLAGSQAGSSAVFINWNSSPVTLLTFDEVPLSNGVQGVPGDGALIEAGYYSLSNSVNAFAGSWVQLAQCSIGDFVTFAVDAPPVYRAEKSAGMFSLTLHTNHPIPSGVMIAFRFYDSTSPSISSRYNAVSSRSWEWVGEPSLKASLDESPANFWLGGSNSAFRTTIPIPEPSTPWIVGTGMIFALGRRKRTRSSRCSFSGITVDPSTEQHR